MKETEKKQREITHFFKGIGISIGRLTPVVSQSGRFGCVTIFRHPELGKVFVLKDEIQHVEAWAPLYHEPLVHLPASFVNKVKDVLILGGGTLYAASEALKYKSVERVVVLDHDPDVSKLAAEHYGHARDCFNDKRFKLSHADAYSSIRQLKDQFDLIINDGADLMSAKAAGEIDRSGSDLFLLMTKALRPTGVCADVVYRHVFEKQRTVTRISRLQRHARLALSLVFLPEYHGTLHVLTIWGKQTSNVNQAQRYPVNREQRNWIKVPAVLPCVYYDPRFLRYYLYLPPYIRNALISKKRAV